MPARDRVDEFAGLERQVISCRRLVSVSRNVLLRKADIRSVERDRALALGAGEIDLGAEHEEAPAPDRR